MVNGPVQRKLVAILAADVVGFSSLMERDEEGTYARIGRLRREVIEPRLSEQQGRLFKTMGDGFLAEFASPLALRCAMSIQSDLGKDSVHSGCGSVSISVMSLSRTMAHLCAASTWRLARGARIPAGY